MSPAFIVPIHPNLCYYFKEEMYYENRTDRSWYYGQAHGEEPAQAGYDLTVSDLNQASVDEIVAAGAKAATKQRSARPATWC